MVFSIVASFSAQATMFILLAVTFFLVRQKSKMAYGAVGASIPYFPALVIFLLASPYLLLGPFQPVTAIDLFYILPVLDYLSDHVNNRFFHEFAGGIDRHAGFVYSAGLVSVERFLASLFPIWVVHAIYKLVALTLAVAGFHLIGTRLLGLPSFLATILGVLFAFNDDTTLIMTFGIGCTVIPMVVYAFHRRCGDISYFGAIFGLGLLTAIFSSAYHTAPAMFFAVLMTFIIWRPLRWHKAILGLILLAVPILVNWSEVIFGLLQTAAYSSRWSRDEVTSLIDLLIQGPGGAIFMLPFVIAAVFLNRTKNLSRAFGAVIIGFATAYALNWLSAGHLSGTVLGKYDFGHLNFGGLDFLVLILVGTAVSATLDCDKSKYTDLAKAVTVCGLLAAAIVQLIGEHAELAATYFGKASMAAFALPSQLDQTDWRFDEPVRALAVPYRYFPNMSLHHGISSVDGRLNLISRDYDEFLQMGVFRRERVSNNSASELCDCGTEWRADGRVNAEKLFDRTLLGMLNVGYVISKLPLDGPGLTLLEGPQDDHVPTNIDSPYYKLFIRPFRQDPVYVYSPDGFLPRAFGGGPPVPLDDTATLDTVFDLLRKYRGRLGTVVSRNDAKFFPKDGELTVEALSMTVDGFDVDVLTPDGGILVVVAAWTPWWSATADGGDIPVLKANKAHIAMPIPPGTKNVSIRYDRPRLLDKFRLGGSHK